MYFNKHSTDHCNIHILVFSIITLYFRSFDSELNHFFNFSDVLRGLVFEPSRTYKSSDSYIILFSLDVFNLFDFAKSKYSLYKLNFSDHYECDLHLFVEFANFVKFVNTNFEQSDNDYRGYFSINIDICRQFHLHVFAELVESANTNIEQSNIDYGGYFSIIIDIRRQFNLHAFVKSVKFVKFANSNFEQSNIDYRDFFPVLIDIRRQFNGKS
ncbi:MAG: hypothetical protein Q9171_006942 [Xanthocarpia ochracea]